ncbi:TerD family protein [Filifactor villosus]|uniref:TerD family protein n=1 Tax=Filifactor villosus TaxID=29374 RepID=A0ABV9QN18_9FIRM
MVIPMHSKGSVDKNTVLSINRSKVQATVNAQNVLSLNKPTWSSEGPVATSTDSSMQATPSSPTQTELISKKPIPTLNHPIQKGQKVALATNSSSLSALFGWNVKNSQCDVDVSAFLLGENGKVLGDDWFVFYGQPQSPDKSILLSTDESVDRQKVSIDFRMLHPNVKKIVFVLTINEAFEHNLNFSMIEDAYMRVVDPSGNELVSFAMNDYYDNVISMMIGEVYLYNSAWKFSSVGNGVARDLAGLCELYGVQVN